jgi:hypothetical protein
MSTPVSDVLSSPASEAAADSAAPDLALVAPATPGFILSTVDLPEAAQALSFQEQGNTPFEIAQALGTIFATSWAACFTVAPALRRFQDSCSDKT